MAHIDFPIVEKADVQLILRGRTEFGQGRQHPRDGQKSRYFARTSLAFAHVIVKLNALLSTTPAKEEPLSDFDDLQVAPQAEYTDVVSRSEIIDLTIAG